MKARRYERMHTLWGWLVLDTQTSKYASQAYKGDTAKVFTGHLADSFNADNRTVMDRFMIGDNWLEALSLPADAKPKEERKIGYRGTF